MLDLKMAKAETSLMRIWLCLWRISSNAYQGTIREGYKELKFLKALVPQHLFYVIRFQKIYFDFPSTTVLASFMHELFSIRTLDHT